MATPQRMPNGKYRMQVSKNGVRKSFTASSYKACRDKANAWQTLEEEGHCSQTVSEAGYEYIENRSNVLSPKTIKEYKVILKYLPEDIAESYIHELSNEKVQRWVNQMSMEGLSPKTIKNKYGLVSTVIKNFDGRVLNVKLPQRVRIEPYIPTTDEVNQLISMCSGDLLTAVLLASRAGLRRSEICALKNSPDSFKRNEIRVSQAMVIDENNDKIIKNTKTYESQRIVTIPNSLKEHLLTLDGEYVVNTNPNNLTNQFCKKVAKSFDKTFSLHDLRHYYCSVLLDNNIPLYKVQRLMGHSTPDMTQRVYAHLLREKNNELTDGINNFFQ